jgi:O-antigen/teichoic acid export membrane protein
MVIKVTIWALPLIGAEMMMSYALNAAGREAAQARASMWAAVTSLTLATVMIARWGLSGACWVLIVRFGIKICFLLLDFIQTMGIPRWSTTQALRIERAPIDARDNTSTLAPVAGP